LFFCEQLTSALIAIDSSPLDVRGNHSISNWRITQTDISHSLKARKAIYLRLFKNHQDNEQLETHPYNK
jgi:hypothetical protein